MCFLFICWWTNTGRIVILTPFLSSYVSSAASFICCPQTICHHSSVGVSHKLFCCWNFKVAELSKQSRYRRPPSGTERLPATQDPVDDELLLQRDDLWQLSVMECTQLAFVFRQCILIFVVRLCVTCAYTLFVRLSGGKEKRARTLRRRTNSMNPMTNQPSACWKQEKIKRAFTRLAQDLGRSN